MKGLVQELRVLANPRSERRSDVENDNASRRLVRDAADRIEKLENWHRLHRREIEQLRQRVEALEQLIAAAKKLEPWVSASLDDPNADRAHLEDAHAFLEALAKVDVP
jgi:thiamine kinase-like enzyme